MAYAAMIALNHTIQRLRSSTTKQIRESVYEQLELRHIIGELRSSSRRRKCTDTSAIDAVDAEIREEVWKLEDAFESHTFFHLLQPLDDDDDINRSPQIPLVDKTGVRMAIFSFLKTFKKLTNKYIRELGNRLPEQEEAVSSSIHDFDGEKLSTTTTVGLSDQIGKIRDELLDSQSRDEAILIVGMAGIGKTHLAREIYHDPKLVHHFDSTAWVRVGRKERVANIIIDIVSQLEQKPRNLVMEKDMFTLAVCLQKNMSGKKFLVVLDDVWSVSFCAQIMMLLPTNANGMRILVTTRLEEVAKYFDCRIHPARFLSSDESWNLLRRYVFGDESSFPPQLEDAGRKIAENCEGLPLLILAVAEILRGLDMTEEYWKKVAENKTTTFEEAYDKISSVLISSYQHLPEYLKGCFLYMGVFPRRSEIPIRKLTNLWMVEDFLQAQRDRDIQDVITDSVEKIVSNSLAIVCKQSSVYKTKSCKLHGAYWHLCVKQARKNKLFRVLKKLTDVSKDCLEGQRRLSVQNNVLFGLKEARASMSAAVTVRSLLCTGKDHEYPVQICWNLVLVKLLDALSIRFYEFPVHVLKFLHLRYLALTHNGKVPSSISKLQYLHFLIFRQHHNVKLLGDPTYLPKEIWDMQQLRHLRIVGSNLPDPSSRAWLPNLLSLNVNARSCTMYIFMRIPNLKKLGISIELQPEAAENLNCFEHIGVLHVLESLKCVVVNPRLRTRVVAPPEHLSNFPRRLMKLSLNGLGYSWKCMSAIGSLPLLKVLKLRCCAFQGVEWETKVGEFESLEYLLLEDVDLVHWKTEDDDCLFNLWRLIMRHCYKLKEIPSQTGGIRALETIEVVDCSPSVVAAVVELQSKRPLLVTISSSWKLPR